MIQTKEIAKHEHTIMSGPGNMKDPLLEIWYIAMMK
jgi:hypothetical protein